jgi:hypothetical protein
MLNFNFLVIFLASLVPLALGNIWYNPKVFGNIWMSESGIKMDDSQKVSMLRTFGLTFVFGFFIAFGLQFAVIHQFGMQSMLMNHDGSIDSVNGGTAIFASAMEKYGMAYRTFKHGALHGFMVGLLSAIPFLGVPALFERKSNKYILIHGGFWIVCLMIMGGIICQWT